MTTIEFLKEMQRIQLETAIHKLPIHLTISAMPECNHISVWVQGTNHEVIISGIAVDHPLVRDEIEALCNNVQSVISKYTAVKQAG